MLTKENIQEIQFVLIHAHAVINAHEMTFAALNLQPEIGPCPLAQRLLDVYDIVCDAVEELEEADLPDDAPRDVDFLILSGDEDEKPSGGSGHSH